MTGPDEGMFEAVSDAECQEARRAVPDGEDEEPRPVVPAPVDARFPDWRRPCSKDAVGDLNPILDAIDAAEEIPDPLDGLGREVRR